jgi:hypothetical protein
MSITASERGKEARAPTPKVAPAAPLQPALDATSATRFAGGHSFILQLIAELKRRNVVRVGLLYLTFCWVVLDPVHVIFHMLDVPLWANELVLVAMALGLPTVLLFTWLFEFTPSGIKATVLVDPRKSIRVQTGRRLDRAIIVVLSLVVVYLMVDRWWPAKVAPQAAGAPSAPSVVPAQSPAATSSTPPPSSPSAALSPSPAPSSSPAPAPVAKAAATVPAATTTAAALAASAAPSLPAEAAAKSAGLDATVTILDGPALFIRGASRFVAAPGVKLTGGDIVATGADALVQLELEGGTQIALGPQTRLMLLPAGAGPAPLRAAYLLAGWIKVTAGTASPPPLDVLRTSRFELGIANNVSVTRLEGEEASVFAELGSARIAERRRGGAPAPVALKPGQFYSQRAQAAGVVLGQPSPQFLQQLPAPFRDTLPSRIDAFRARMVAARPAPDFAYADVEPWLKSDGAIRRQLTERWKDKANEPAFRRSLEANLRDLPEWRPILYPPPPIDPDGAHAPAEPTVAKSPPS